MKITDDFWQPRLLTHANVTLQAGLNQCENETQRIKNFAIAAGLIKGVFKGFVYDDSDLYKMLEGASYSLMNNPNPALESKLDSIISLISAAQMPDGYLMTYFELGDITKRWTDMNMHEMYCCGHLIEAGIAYYNATGKRSLLNVAINYANHIDKTFGEGKRVWVPGHEEIELALVKLYRVTQDQRYLKLAKWLLEQRGHNNATWDPADKDYYQDLVPVKDLKKISGHAVRSMYLFTGMADVSSAINDTTYLPALDRLWDDVVKTKMYITGGIGSSKVNEGFSEDYDLPNEDAYCETCASVGMVLWNQRMNMLKGDGKYVDVLERSMYNGALAGISLSGDRFFYVNPLASSGNHHRKAWYGTACCPSQISRFLPSIGNYIYATSTDNSIWVNLYIGSETTIKTAGNSIDLKQETTYPWYGKVTLRVNPQKSKAFKVKLRLPGWCKKYDISVNGHPVKTQMELHYLIINRKWKKGDVVTFNMDMPVEVVAADPRVKADAGKRTIQRGPIVYCMEEVDNKSIDSAKIDASTQYTATFEPDLLGSVVEITAKAGNQVYTFIPYYAWDNRQAGKMKVWVDYK
ncbi:MAG: glycoside hydrolase family 127 protein [Bacteroidota bacterium]|nr:glycoside hydrolase family 127 protein [Bacteroidota bacterium]